MRFNKKFKRGLFFICLLLLITFSISFLKYNPKSDILDKNSVFISAPEDPYEENDDPLSAYNISSAEANWLSSFGSNGTQGDDDWYIIDLDPGEERLRTILIFNHSAGNIDLEVYNWDFNLMVGNYSGDDNEILELDLFPSGNYYLRIFGDNLNNTYDLWWEDLNPVDDQFEDNDDFWQSRYVHPNYYSHLKIVYDDEDWFKVYLNYSYSINISIYFDNYEGDLDFELYDPYNSNRAGSYTDADNESIYFTADIEGNWSIHIYNVYGNSEVFYDLDIWIYGIDDWYEPNNDFWDARYMSPGFYSDLRIIHRNEDWFRTYVDYLETIEIRIYFEHTKGNLELELYDSSYGFRKGSYSTDNDEFISYSVLNSRDWYFRIYHVDKNSEVHYDLQIRVYREDDKMEENDNYESARWVGPQFYHDLIVIEGDEDWFMTYLNVDDTIDINIYYDNYQGNLQLELYDPIDSSNPREGSYTTYNDEHIFFIADLSGDWHFRIYHQSGNSNVSYSLEVRINGEIGGDDPYEWNNDFNEAYNLIDDEHIWLSKIHGLAVQGDFDWFMIDVTPGFQHLMINIKFNRSIGNINVNIYRLIGIYNIDWVASNDSLMGNDCIDINITNIEWGIYFIQIHGDSSGVEYDLWWDDILTDNRIDDYYEENDDPGSAYDLSFYQYEELMWINELAIQKDNDWYKIHVGVGYEHLFLLVKYDYQEGAIGIEIYDWQNKKVTSNFTMKDNEMISYTLPSNGTYYIRIFGDRSGNTYSLVWSTREPGTEEMIPGYDIIILLGVILSVGVVFTVRWKRNRSYL